MPIEFSAKKAYSDVKDLFKFAEGISGMERTAFLELLKDSYSAYYNIIPVEENSSLPLAFRADYFSRAEQYWLTKKITVWANETNEFAYIFAADKFDKDTVDACVKAAIDESLPRVKPHKEHQCSNVKTVFVADSFDDEIIKHIKKLKFDRSYKFGLHGFTTLKAAAVSLETQKVYPNNTGSELVKYFSKLFAAAAKAATGESK